VAEEYCWAITQAAGRSCCGRSGYRVLEFGFQLDSRICSSLNPDMRKIRLAPDLPVSTNCASRGVGRAMAQAVSRRPPTAEARVRSRVSPCGICGGQSGTGIVLRVSPVSFIPPVLHYLET
jgi:hypothetical protein